jgi:predicted membrane metal-binding protein
MLPTPGALAGPSVQMSFAAVAGLIAFYEAMRERLSQWRSYAGLPRRCGPCVLGIVPSRRDHHGRHHCRSPSISCLAFDILLIFQLDT